MASFPQQRRRWLSLGMNHRHDLNEIFVRHRRHNEKRIQCSRSPHGEKQTTDEPAPKFAKPKSHNEGLLPLTLRERAIHLPSPMDDPVIFGGQHRPAHATACAADLSRSSSKATADRKPIILNTSFSTNINSEIKHI